MKATSLVIGVHDNAGLGKGLSEMLVSGTVLIQAMNERDERHYLALWLYGGHFFDITFKVKRTNPPHSVKKSDSVSRRRVYCQPLLFAYYTVSCHGYAHF
jgi:hypothetical protein